MRLKAGFTVGTPIDAVNFTPCDGAKRWGVHRVKRHRESRNALTHTVANVDLYMLLQHTQKYEVILLFNVN